MPRNIKCRKVCAEFQNKGFSPYENGKEYITITVDELEALRLCDLENKNQEDAASKMDVSRGTFQRILYSARKKTAEALCEGRGIIIQGGNYEITNECCNGSSRCKKCIKMIRKSE